MLLMIGVSHRRAPLDLLERLSLSEPGRAAARAELVAAPEVAEAVVLSTCNRSELYLAADDAQRAVERAAEVLRRTGGISREQLAAVLTVARGDAAVRHLFRVGSGLESLVVGEAEIQGQVRRAFAEASAAGSVGPQLDGLFRAALASGKRVRAHRDDRAQPSVSAAAVALATERLGSLAGRAIGIVGAGEIGALVAHAMSRTGAASITVTSRRLERSREVAHGIAADALSLDRLPALLERADVVVTATSATSPVIDVPQLVPAVEARDGRELLLIDLAVPRDVAVACGRVDGVRLLDLDDVRRAPHAVDAAEPELRELEAIVDEEFERFAVRLRRDGACADVAALRAHADGIARQVLDDNAGRWESISARDHARVTAVAEAIVNRLLHAPTRHVKQLDARRDAARLQHVRELFGLPEPDVEPALDGDRPAPAAVARGLAGKSSPPYFVCLRLRGRTCVVVGGGDVALAKAEGLLACGATVAIVSPTAVAGVEALAERATCSWIRRRYVPRDLAGAFLAIAATDDSALNARVAEDATRRGVLVNVADAPAVGTFTVPAVAREGPIAVAISTGGASPALAKRLRREILEQFGPPSARLAQLLEAAHGWAVEQLPRQPERREFLSGIVNGSPDPLEMLRRGEEARVTAAIEAAKRAAVLRRDARGNA